MKGTWVPRGRRAAEIVMAGALVARAFAAGALVLAGSMPLAQAQTAEVPAVTVVRAGNACLVDRLYFTGALSPRNELVVTPLAEGARVNELLAEEGQEVKNGDLLARLQGVPSPGAPPQNMQVTAPADGVVLSRGARVGSIVAATSPEPLFRIASGGVEVEASVPPVRLAQVSAGQPARVQIPGAGEVSGTVRIVAAEIDRQTRLGKARITLEGNPTVRYGSTVNGFIETGRGCGVVVPVPALVARGQDTFVQRVQNGRVETRRVRLGLVEGGQVQIVEGLAEGDTIVARAGAFLRDGDVVRPVEMPPAQAQPGQGASAAQAAGARP